MDNLIIVIFFLMSLILSTGACYKEKPTEKETAPAPTVTEKPKTWQPVKTWAGNGAKQTETFGVASSEWRISWQTSNSNYGILQIYVYDGKGNMISLAANAQGKTNDTTYIHQGPGKYYLSINSCNEDWKITVEDQR
jgi:hypothetical protein